MDQATRSLMLKICAGDMRIPPHLFALRGNPRRVEFMTYAVQRGLVGAAFLEWLRLHYEGSILNALKDVCGGPGRAVLHLRR
jgi:hypothetical protein